MRLAAILAIAATPAIAAPVNLTNVDIPGDTAVLEMESAFVGVLTYHNTARQRSAPGEWIIAADNVSCTLSIVVGDAETATVKCDEGWIVEPERAEVPDGESFHFIVTWLGG